MTVNTQQLGAWLLRVLAIASAVIASIPATSIPVSVRPFMVIAAGIILAVDRYVTDPTTGTPAPSPPPSPPPAPAAPAP
jgi:hypothetical protein